MFISRYSSPQVFGVVRPPLSQLIKLRCETLPAVTMKLKFPAQLCKTSTLSCTKRKTIKVWLVQELGSGKSQALAYGEGAWSAGSHCRQNTPECVPGSCRALVSGEYYFPWADTWLTPRTVLPVGLVTGTSTFSRAMEAVSHEATK